MTAKITWAEGAILAGMSSYWIQTTSYAIYTLRQSEKGEQDNKYFCMVEAHNAKWLTMEDVRELGEALIKIADAHLNLK